MIYLDWAATSLVDQDIISRIQNVEIDHPGNPSSIHLAGRQTALAVSQARIRMAHAIGCLPEEIIFTSGATESNNMILFSLLKRSMNTKTPLNGKNIIVSGLEHSSVFIPAMSLKQAGIDVKVVCTGKDGIIDPGVIADNLDKNTFMVSLMHVNNETGVISPVKEIAGIIKDHSSAVGRKILFHSDAVQSFGKIDFNPYDLGMDSASFSAHKISGPRGIGALFLKKGTDCDFLYQGGSQEKGKRAGTENLYGITGFSLAAEKAKLNLKANYEKAIEIMSYLIDRLSGIPHIKFIPEQRTGKDFTLYSPYILKIAFPPIPSEVLVRVLDDNQILISTGSACSSKDNVKFSRVLENMHLDNKTAGSTIRISIGPATVKQDIDELHYVLNKVVPGLINITG